jgi:hypothetical protein
MIAAAKVTVTNPPADLVLARILADRDNELAAWRVLYDACHPAPAGYTGSALDRRVA